MSLLGRVDGPVVVGHRGGRGEGWPPENSLASFERARSQGAHAIETAVRLAASGEVVAFHDPTLARMTDGRDTREVARLDRTELGAVRLGASTERIPRLPEVLEWAEQAGCGLNIEVKHDVPDRWALAREVARHLSKARIPVLVSSFDPVALLALGVLAPAVPRALLTHPAQKYAPILHTLAHPRFLTALHAERRETHAAQIQTWKRRGLRVGVWTVNDTYEARRLVADGTDLLITDEPGKILAALST